MDMHPECTYLTHTHTHLMSVGISSRPAQTPSLIKLVQEIDRWINSHDFDGV